jgi:hypothetical protein
MSEASGRPAQEAGMFSPGASYEQAREIESYFDFAGNLLSIDISPLRREYN